MRIRRTSSGRRSKCRGLRRRGGRARFWVEEDTLRYCVKERSRGLLLGHEGVIRMRSSTPLRRAARTRAGGQAEKRDDQQSLLPYLIIERDSKLLTDVPDLRLVTVLPVGAETTSRRETRERAGVGRRSCGREDEAASQHHTAKARPQPLRHDRLRLSASS